LHAEVRRAQGSILFNCTTQTGNPVDSSFAVAMVSHLTDEQIEEVFKTNVLGHIGCNDGFNTYVMPINYVYDGKYIICHSAMGSKIRVMQQNNRVCFHVEEIINFSNWKSLLALGLYQELADERDRRYAMKLLVDRMLHIKISEDSLVADITGKQIPSILPENRRPVIYRIVLTEKSGRFEKE